MIWWCGGNGGGLCTTDQYCQRDDQLKCPAYPTTPGCIQAAQVRSRAAKSEGEVRHTSRQAAALQRHSTLLRDLEAAHAQQAAAASHSSQLLFLHTQLTVLAAQMRAEASHLRVQDLEGRLTGEPTNRQDGSRSNSLRRVMFADAGVVIECTNCECIHSPAVAVRPCPPVCRVHEAAAPRLQQRAEELLGAASQLWELVQDAEQQEPPALAQLCTHLEQLAQEDEAQALDDNVQCAASQEKKDGANRVGVKQEDVSPREMRLRVLRDLVAQGQRAAAVLAQLRAVRRHVAEGLVLQSAGAAQLEHILRNGAAFSDGTEQPAASQRGDGAAMTPRSAARTAVVSRYGDLSVDKGGHERGEVLLGEEDAAVSLHVAQSRYAALSEAAGAMRRGGASLESALEVVDVNAAPLWVRLGAVLETVRELEQRVEQMNSANEPLRQHAEHAGNLSKTMKVQGSEILHVSHTRVIYVTSLQLCSPRRAW